MKIKTITCHDIYNIGASLQAYALATYLQELGHDVQIIDYKPTYLRHYRLCGVNNPVYDKPVLREVYNILKFPGRLKARGEKRKKSFDLFTQTYLPVTEQTFPNNEMLKQAPPEADVYFAGSDQIWNTLFQNGKDPAFYLDFAPSKAVCASYAASFSTDSIAEEWKTQVKRWISRLDYISVRESTGVKLLREMGFSDVEQVMDPVFLLSKEHWCAMADAPVSQQPYVLVYDFEQDEKIGTLARKMADENGWRVYSVLKNPWCDKSFEQEGPTAFLSLVRDAQFVLSNSFHATAFSLIFEKPFYVFERSENINTRMADLVQAVGLSEHNIQQFPASLPKTGIDYEDVDHRLALKIANSKDFIHTVLLGAAR